MNESTYDERIKALEAQNAALTKQLDAARSAIDYLVEISPTLRDGSDEDIDRTAKLLKVRREERSQNAVIAAARRWYSAGTHVSNPDQRETTERELCDAINRLAAMDTNGTIAALDAPPGAKEQG